MESRLIKWALGGFTALIVVFLYAPLAVLAILSFQTGPEGGPQFPIVAWSVYWYKHLFGLTPPSRIAPLPIESALARSLTLAVMTMIVSTVLGVMAAQAFRTKFKGAGLVFYLIILGMMVPGVLSAMLFAFTLSYDEFSRTLFTSGRELTLPLAIYGTFSVEIHPNIFAFGVLTTLFSFAL